MQLGVGLLLVLAWVGDLLVVGVLVAVAALVLMGAGQAFRQARLIADTPTSTIRGAAQGRVELKAHIPLDRPLTGPLSGEECSFWCLTVEQTTGRGKDARVETIGRAWSGGEWQAVADGTGTCLLAMPDSTITSRLSQTRTITGPGLDGLGMHFRPELRPALHGPAQQTVTEQRFPVGAEIHVIGLFQSVPSNRTPFDEDWSDRILRGGAASPAWARKLAALARAAGAADRETLKEEWRVRMRALEGVAEGAPLAGTVMVHTMRQDFRQNRVFPLLVSDHREGMVITGLRNGAVASLAIGLAMLAGAFAVLAYRWPALFDALAAGFR
ncbi:MAG: hypothetical protein LDL44_02105 [Caenispirillum sp.]|nr:hypothetical protein [Caenispirillum sp.]